MKTTGIDRCLLIHWRAETLTRQKIEARRRLARHYAAKAGYPNADGYLFHCLRNWTIGNGCEAKNVFAHKAVEAWMRQYDGTFEFTQTVWRKAYDKYVRRAAA